MKLTLFVLAGLVVAVASVCHTDADCGTDNSPCNHGEHYKCVHSKCACSKVKRAGPDCKTESDCTCSQDSVASCVNSHCYCNHHGKRQGHDHCDMPSECKCGHNEIASCTNHQCACTDKVGRREQIHCQTDDDCVNYNCASHPGDTPYCLHHGDPAHGHNLCACK